MPAGQVLTRLQRQRADKRKNPPITSLSSIPPPPTKKLKGSAYCQSSENSTIDLDSVTASTSTAYGCEIITNNNCADETYSGTCLNSVPSLGSLAATSTGSSSSSGNCDTSSSSTSSSTTTEEEVLSFGNKPFESNNLQYFTAVDTLKRLPLQFSKQNFTNN
uniref:Uncharacterized protein n=1 Tax=Panagrolaimus sp. PS1159 TaxID=55785 RepID=A0AC35G5X5_9BILA